MDPRDTSFWDRMLERRFSRRTLIRATAAVLGTAWIPPLAAATRTGRRPPAPLDLHRFTPIAPTREDDLVLPPEFAYRLLLRWGDSLNDRGERFGFNCDFGAFLPLPGPRRPGVRSAPAGRVQPDHRALGGARRRIEGLYVVNHEYPDPRLLPSVAEQKESVGLSVAHLVRDEDGTWRVRLDSPYARRYTGSSRLRMSGPAAGLAGEGGLVTGTMGNCSGAVTPWGTVLSCEENTAHYGEPAGEGGYGWGGPHLRSEHYSWVLEVDPYDAKFTPVKRTALGRFRHENVAIRIARDGRLVAYMGDDARDAFVYKYVSEGRYDPARGRENGDLLDAGRLFVAAFREDGSGFWTPLPMSEECLRDTWGFILDRDLPATPMDQPEDLEVHPADGSVYVALTNNANPAAAGRVVPPLEPDPYGKIVRLVEAGGEPTAGSFRWQVFAAGGPQAGFAAPDNLEFDRYGNLWIACDFASDRAEYEAFGNVGMYMVPTSGRNAGVAYQFASGPVGAELAGPWLSPDETALFLSVQHPGQGSRSREAPTSHWPDGEGLPKPSCVVITRRR